MATAAKRTAQMDDKWSQISQYCLGIHMILRPILEHFSTKELIHLSLVNRLWNYEARSVLRDRGDLRAYFSRGGIYKVEDCPCHELQAFASDLANMQVVPFSGLHLPVNHRSLCTSLPNSSLHSSCKVILDRLHWKKFAVEFNSNTWKYCKDCPAVTFVQQILEIYCGTLEELTLGFANEELLRLIFQDRILPHLKRLTIMSWLARSVAAVADGSVSSTFIIALVSSAPNLEELHVNEDIDLTVNLLEGSSAVLVADFGLSPLLKPICDDLISSLRSDKMTIMVHTEDIYPGLLNDFIPKVLHASRSTLKTLIIDYLFVLPLMCYGICLENVTTLQIHMNSYRLKDIEPWILALPTGLDFNCIFPKLNQVIILDDYDVDFSSDVVGAFFEYASVLLSRASPDRATNIKHLDLERCSAIEDTTLPLLALMFPHVKTVHTQREHQGALFEDLPQHFSCLFQVTQSECGMAF